MSEWPIGLLLDEVWLRGRRRLVVRLEEAGLWPGSAEFSAFLAGQRDLGVRLRDSMLVPSLHPEDRRWLAAPALFGAATRRFRSRVPLALAFGFGLGDGLQAIERLEVDPCLAETCALFNFGVSIFDLLQDTQPHLTGSFAAFFDEGVLHALNESATASAELQQRARSAPEPEVRLVLHVIAEVFRRLHLSSGERGLSSTALPPLLISAHAAENRSACCRDLPLTERLALSRSKSTLPFVIIERISALGSSCGDNAVAPTELVERIGTIFWLTDDLADVVADARSGGLNALLVQATRGERLPLGPALRALLDGEVFEETAETICSAMRDMAGQLTTRGESGTNLARLVGSYVRMWLE